VKESVMDDWAKQRLAELEAAAPVKRKNRKGAFVKVPLWWIEQVTRATKSPQVFAAIWLLHLSWRAKSTTFTLSNARLAKHGVDRQAKRRALANLEKAGLITVERRNRKPPRVTLVLM
jgi:hypothetical protein